MRQFLTGLLLGIAVTYFYAYEKDAFVDQVQAWFAQASHDADADAKIDKMTARRH
jgi:hypothetical protein